MGMTKTKASKPQMNLLRSMLGLEARQARMKPSVYTACEERGWISVDDNGRREITEAGRAIAGN